MSKWLSTYRLDFGYQKGQQPQHFTRRKNANEFIYSNIAYRYTEVESRS
jgi:hypothetical protein